jgi:hypothetical protein
MRSSLRSVLLAASIWLCLGLTGLVGLGPPALAQMTRMRPLPGTPELGTPSDPAHFTFLVAGDDRPAAEADPPTPTIATIFAAAKQLKPAFVVTLGDTIYGKNPHSRPTIAKEYDAFLTLALGSGATVFNAPGNHELDDADDVPNPLMTLWYGQLMDLPFGAFTYGNSRFILLNTEELPPAGIKRSPGATTAGGKHLDPGWVSPLQLKALRQELDNDQAAAHVFVFMHHPIEPKDKNSGLDKASAKALTALFKRYKNISFVLAAHEHVYFNPQDPGNVTTVKSRTDPSDKPPTYLVSGGAGAPLNGTPAEGGFFHYLVFKVAANRVDVSLVNLGTGSASPPPAGQPASPPAAPAPPPAPRPPGSRAR